MSGFESIAKEYDKGRSREDVEFWADEAKRLAKLDEWSIVLDLGCGTGIYTMGIRGRTFAVMCGLDPVGGMLGKAREKSKDVSWLNAVGEWAPFRPAIFTCVFSSQVWHHIREKQKTADECFNALRPGGALIIRTISHEQLRERVVFKYFPEILSNQLEVYPSREDFNRYFDNAGFASTEHHRYTLERYQPASEFIEVAEKKLWSMFRPITDEGLKRGVEELNRHEKEHPGQPIRNDETITLVVAKKKR